MRRATIGVLLVALLCVLSGASVATARTASDWAGAAFRGLRGPSWGGRVNSDDLLRMRDLGGLSVSPDGRWLAFSVRQADPERNRYVMRWFVMSTAAGAEPRLLRMEGGQPIPSYAFGRPHAYIIPEAAQWSADSGRLAFRRLVDHRIELWSADPVAGSAQRVAGGVAQVTRFRWMDARRLIFRTGLDYGRYQRNLAIKARNGWLSDGRIAPFASQQRPAEPECLGEASDPACDVATWVSERGSGLRRATEEEDRAFEQARAPAAGVEPGPSRRVGLASAWRDGAVTWTENVHPEYVGAVFPLQRITTNRPGTKPCVAAACLAGRSGFRGIGWARDGTSVWLLKGESNRGRADGAPYDLSGLYEWRLATGDVRRVWHGDDLVEDCHVRGHSAYCMMEGPTRPRHIVRIDLDDGAVRTLADPNPQFAAKSFPTVRKVLLDGLGNPAFGHVVYPYDYKPGRPCPLVIVQYLSKGFLRGGVGSEVPIYPLAGEGFAVLSVDRPFFWDAEATLGLEAYEKFRLEDGYRDRRAAVDAIDRAVADLVAEGLVDRDRVAITGLSSGAEIVHFALQRSTRYAAAIASSGAHDLTFLALMPPSRRRSVRMAAIGAESLLPEGESALDGLAWSRMPEKLRAPLLINVGEHEAMLGFEGLQALHEARRPLEVRVFPDEFHIKYHPASLRGVFQNNLMWLKFWIFAEEDPRPEFQAQYARWRAMSERLGREG